MNKVLITIILALLPAVSFAAVEKSCGEIECDHVSIDLHDQASLQRGAHLFVNYCLSCHSASYMRYNRMGADLGISDSMLKKYMGFIPDKEGKFKVGELMKANMTADVAKAAFNTVPPDLSDVARSRGADWFYTYMRSFYRDNTPSGWNNAVFPHVAMPDVLYGLQGIQRAVFKTEPDGEKIFEHFEMQQPGKMTEKQYNNAMRDLTNFMVYMGEPAKLVRYRLGIYVMLFLAVLLLFSWLLKKDYWKDIH
jgi:ubiquinol-cytochrome c reductase cytochrome c1 subunit